MFGEMWLLIFFLGFMLSALVTVFLVDTDFDVTLPKYLGVFVLCVGIFAFLLAPVGETATDHAAVEVVGVNYEDGVYAISYVQDGAIKVTTCGDVEFTSGADNSTTMVVTEYHATTPIGWGMGGETIVIHLPKGATG